MTAALALNAVPYVTALLGPSAEKLLKNVNLNPNVSEKSSEDYLHFELAPSYGKLKEGTAIEHLDNNLKIMITATHKLIAKMPVSDRTWDNIVAAIAQNPLIEPHHEPVIERSESLIKEGFHAFKFDGSPSSAIVQEVFGWFNKLISDEDVTKTIGFQLKDLAEIVAQTGATVTGVASVVGKVEEHQKDVLDIGILRYPDLDNPFFKIYRIKLVSWSKCDRTLMIQKDSNGISGTYYCRKYIPRKNVMDGLNTEIKKKAISEAEDFLSGL